MHIDKEEDEAVNNFLYLLVLKGNMEVFLLGSIPSESDTQTHTNFNEPLQGAGTE